MTTTNGDPFEMATDLPGEQFGEPIHKHISEVSLIGKNAMVISRPGTGPSNIVGLTGTIIDARVIKYPKSEIQVYRVKLNRPPTGVQEWDEGLWLREEDLEVIQSDED